MQNLKNAITTKQTWGPNWSITGGGGIKASPAVALHRQINTRLACYSTGHSLELIKQRNTLSGISFIAPIIIQYSHTALQALTRHFYEDFTILSGMFSLLFSCIFSTNNNHANQLI